MMLPRSFPRSVRGMLKEALPWVASLPDEDVDRLLLELVTVAKGAVCVESESSAGALLTQWCHTAEVHADPALLEIITREPGGDLGPVPVPRVKR